jgi:zinc transport system substrate-binding protein
MRRCAVRLTALLALALPATASVFAAERIPVAVTLLPQQYFVERVGGDRVEVTVIVPPGADAHTYEPKPRQMAALAKARAYFAVGDPFEDVWLAKLKGVNRDMTVVHTDAGIEKLPMEVHDEHAEAHGHAPGGAEEQHEGGRHEEGLHDPHIWLSPPLVKIQARHIRDGLIALDGANRAAYEEGFRRFSAELDALDAELRALFKDLGTGREFMIFHPAWGYFAQAYGLVQVPVEAQGKSPRPAQLAALIDHARRRGIKAIFVQPQRSTRAAETIAQAIGGAVVVADDLAPDWAENLRRVARQVRAAAR